MSKFAICKQTAITVSGNIPDSVVAYGLYIPKQPYSAWDTGWQRPQNYPVFTHFWVEKDGSIIDHAAEQFGEPPEVITTTDDKHYVKVGVYDLKNDKPVPQVKNPTIFWNTLKGGDGGLVEVSWPDVEEYLKTL